MKYQPADLVYNYVRSNLLFVFVLYIHYVMRSKAQLQWVFPPKEKPHAITTKLVNLIFCVLSYMRGMGGSPYQQNGQMRIYFELEVIHHSSKILFSETRRLLNLQQLIRNLYIKYWILGCFRFNADNLHMIWC